MTPQLNALDAQAQAAMIAGDLAVVKTLARQMKPLPGGQPVAQHWLGMVAVREGDVVGGIRLLRMVVNQQPNNGVAARQLAYLLGLKHQDFAGAVEVLRGHLKIAPGDRETLVALAEAERDSGDFTHLEARIKALESSVGPVRNARMFGWLWRCMSEHVADWPDGNMLGLVDPRPQDRAQMWFWLMIRAWLGRREDDLETALTGLKLAMDAVKRAGADGVAGERESTDKALQGIFGFYQTLVMLKRQCGMPPPAVAGAKRIWVLGDSHGLSPFGQVVQREGQDWQFETALVAGIKYWHLVAPRPNRYAALLKHWLAKLPPGEPVVLSLGEIDLRPDEGIWPQIMKGRDRDEVVRATYEGGVARLRAVVDEVCPDRAVWICGAPRASAFKLGSKILTGKEDEFVAMVAKADEVICHAAAAHGFGVVPLHEATRDEAVFLQDGIHLTPRVLAEAWAKARG